MQSDIKDQICLDLNLDINNLRLEREKQELRDFIERDNAAMKKKMSDEEAERQRKEQEMQVKWN